LTHKKKHVIVNGSFLENLKHPFWTGEINSFFQIELLRHLNKQNYRYQNYKNVEENVTYYEFHSVFLLV